MLDIKLLRSDPDLVKRGFDARGVDTAAVDGALSLDTQWREAITRVEELKAQLNAASKSIGDLMRTGQRDQADAARSLARELGDQIAAMDPRIRQLEEDRDHVLFHMPNLPHADTPPGPEENYKIVRTVGEARTFDFEPKAHWDIAADLKLIDFARGARMAGSGFPLFRGQGAQLERGLIAFMLDLHRTKHGYTEWSTPFLLNRKSMEGSGHLPKFEPEMYHDAEDDLFTLPTAEPALINIHREDMLDGRDLPLKYTAYSPCWRREAGAAGKDTRGLLRVHQFDKVEMVRFTHPETSYDNLEEMLSNATDVLDALGLPYRIKLLPAGDISFAAAKCYDVEVYAPGVGAWLEVSSCSNCEDFQARRANIRFRREPGAKPEFVHILNASGLPLARLVAALLETYQAADGSVALPEPVRPYMGCVDALRLEG
jgi:seryl-tRNA synthetase